jgi:epoxyqueuosine reductase
MKIAENLKDWLRSEHDLEAQPLPYYVEHGGLFLKDAAVRAGLGIIGRNNLLVHPEWGPRIRLRAVLIEGDIEPTGPIDGFSPCDTCEAPCQKVCPQQAFADGTYSRHHCIKRFSVDKDSPVPGDDTDRDGHPIMVIKWCRACELVCPVGVPV